MTYNRLCSKSELEMKIHILTHTEMRVDCQPDQEEQYVLSQNAICKIQRWRKQRNVGGSDPASQPEGKPGGGHKPGLRKREVFRDPRVSQRVHYLGKSKRIYTLLPPLPGQPVRPRVGVVCHRGLRLLFHWIIRSSWDLWRGIHKFIGAVRGGKMLRTRPEREG